MSNAGGAGNNDKKRLLNNEVKRIFQQPTFGEVLNITARTLRNNTFSKANRNALRRTSKNVKANINAKTTNQRVTKNQATALANNIRAAILADNTDGLKDLLENPAVGLSGLYRSFSDVLETRFGGKTLWEIAVEKNKPEACKLLLESGARPSQVTQPLVNLAAYYGQLEVVEVLVANGMDINTHPRQRPGQPTTEHEAPILVSLEACISAENHYACGRRYTNDHDLTNRMQRHRSLYGKMLDIFQFALQNGGDVNYRGLGNRTPLRSAVTLYWFKKNAETRQIVEDLLERGADPNVRQDSVIYQQDSNTTTLEYVRSWQDGPVKSNILPLLEAAAGGQGGAAGGATGQGGAAGGATGHGVEEGENTGGQGVVNWSEDGTAGGGKRRRRQTKKHKSRKIRKSKSRS